MTRAEVNEIKARMLADVLHGWFETNDEDAFSDTLTNVKYTTDMLDEILADQTAEAKKQGY